MRERPGMGGIETVAAAVGADLAARLPGQNKKQREGLALLIATECPEDLGRRSYARHAFPIFRHAELEQLLEGAGFSEVAVEREGHRLFGSAVLATVVRPPDGAPMTSATEPRAGGERDAIDDVPG